MRSNPLAEDLNVFMDYASKSTALARAQAGDLGHALRTTLGSQRSGRVKAPQCIDRGNIDPVGTHMRRASAGRSRLATGPEMISDTESSGWSGKGHPCAPSQAAAGFGPGETAILRQCRVGCAASCCGWTGRIARERGCWKETSHTAKKLFDRIAGGA